MSTGAGGDRRREGRAGGLPQRISGHNDRKALAGRKLYVAIEEFPASYEEPED